MRMLAWPARAHMSSVMTPVKVLAGGAAEIAASASRMARIGFIGRRRGEGPALPCGGADKPRPTRLFPRGHQVRRRRTGVHDPDPALRAVFGQSERRLGGHR